MRTRRMNLLCGIVAGLLPVLTFALCAVSAASAQEQTEPTAPPKTPATEPAKPIKPRPTPPPTTPTNPPRPMAETPRSPFVNNPATPQTNQPSLARMSRTPDMFGDSYIPFKGLIFGGNKPSETADLPVGGASRRFKNEHNRALPTNRLVFQYHHFHNAIATRDVAGNIRDNDSVDRFTIGLERTFFEDNMSVELRMPFTATTSLNSDALQYQAGNVGNLTVNLKGLLFNTESQALSFGLAVSAPTGDDLTATLPNVRGTGGSQLHIANRSSYLLPYLAYQAAPNDDWFFHAWLQTDIATGSNRVQVVGNPMVIGVTDQTLLYADVAVGYWLWNNDDAAYLSGLAGLLELHYSTALNDADTASLDRVVDFGTSANRFDAINLTVGAHVKLTQNAILRSGFSFPLRMAADNRFFDAEFTTALMYRY